MAGAVVANHRGYDSHLARGRRNEKGDDSRSWVLAGDAPVGGWCRRRRASPAVGLAAAASAPGIMVARGNGERVSRIGEEKKIGVSPASMGVAGELRAVVRRGRDGSGVLMVGGQWQRLGVERDGEEAFFEQLGLGVSYATSPLLRAPHS